MANIGTLGTVGVGLDVAGSVMSALASYQNAKTQQSILGYQTSLANSNAKIEDALAGIQLQVGQQMEQTARIKGAQMMGSQRAAFGANGVDMSYGSASEVLASTQHETDVNALTIRDNAARAAWQSQVQATNDRNSAAVDTAMQSQVNPGMSATTSLLGGLGNAATAYSKLTGGSF